MRKHIYILSALFIVALLVGIIIPAMRESTNSVPEIEITGNTVFINGSIFAVEIVNTPEARAQGLSGRVSLGQDQGMLFLFNQPAIQSFWMWNMKFPIDIIWINGNEVIGFVESAAPPAGGSSSEVQLPVYQSPIEIDKVLEVNAGTVARLGIEVGTRIEVK